MAICDAIRSGETSAKYAVGAIRKKFYHDNPHVVMFALQVIESCVKNCGSIVHDEIATKAFMEELRELIKSSKEENVKAKLLELLQTWGMAFRSNQKYRIVTDTLNLMKAEGWDFPPVREAEAMYEADNAPDWAEGEVCHRCRVEFGLVTRQHHCRACGQVFCSKCSSKACHLPKFGIEKEVRVCDSCYEIHGPKDSGAKSEGGQDLPPGKLVRKARRVVGPDGVEQIVYDNFDLPEEYLSSSLANQSRAPPAKTGPSSGGGGKTEAELKEEEELQLALALSQSEAQAKEDAKRRGQHSGPKYKPEPEQETVKPVTGEHDPDGELAPELMRYLNRDYWDKKQQQKTEVKAVTSPPTSYPMAGPNAAVASGFDSSAMSQQQTMATQNVLHNLPPALAGGATDPELDEFVTTLKTQVEIFVNRMKSNSSRGRSITNDSSVQTLFMNTMAMHSKLLKHIQDQEDKRVYYEGLQDKIAQVKDARAALDALREEERERKRREAEEAERLRQIQMREKLEVMRKKKQEYLQYQRQLALQKMQEQEAEMKLRQEQAKQQYMMQMQHQQQAYAAAQQGMMQPPGAPGMPPYGQPYPPPMHYPPYMGQPGIGGAPSQGAAGSPMHGGDPAAAAFNMQGMAGALPTMAPNGQMTPQGGPPPPQGIPGAGAVPPPAGPPMHQGPPMPQGAAGGPPPPMPPNAGGPPIPQSNPPPMGQAPMGYPMQAPPLDVQSQQPAPEMPPAVEPPSLINFD